MTSGANQAFRGLESSIPPLNHLERRGAGNWISLQCVNQSRLHSNGSIQMKKERAQGAFKLVNTWRYRENGVPGESMEALNLFPIPGPMHRFHLAICELYSFIISK